MHFIVKLFISVCVIIFCSQIGAKMPKLAGLIAVMPLTGLLVMVWIYSDNQGDYSKMIDYTKGALFGIIPSILFFLTCFICFQKKLSLTIVLCAGFIIWLIAAFIHQLFLK